MKKLREYIEQWLDGKQIKGMHVTLLDIHELIDIYNAIIRKEKPEFINGDVKKILDKCGIKSKEHGIGWKIV